MKRISRNTLKLALPVIVLCSFALSSKATTVVMLSDKEMVVNSRMIVTGQVRSIFSAWDDAQATIWTYVEIQTDQVIKGDAGVNRIILKQPGGVVGTTGVYVYGLPSFEPDQRVLLFLNTSQDGSLHVAHAFMGMFSIVRDGASGREYVKRMIDASEVNLLSRNDNEEITDFAPLSDYLQKIGQVLHTEAAAIAEVDGARAGQPLSYEPAEYLRKKNDSTGYSPQFAFIANGVRWMQADSGQTISYYVNPDNSPLAGGVNTEITRAMNAWAATGAGIRLQIAGQTSSCGLVSDGVNTISFGDCLNQLDPPVGTCSGVLALTRVAYNSGSKVVNGRTFNALVEADLVFNKGMNCFLGSSVNLAEVSCHELGHSIGMAHSDDTSAIMFATAHGRNRDAVLGSDDIAGVLTVYPSTAGGGGGGSNPGTPPTITSLNLPDGVVNQSYRQTLTASGGTPPYSWVYVTGVMPPGLSMTSGGTMQGTPTRAGSYSIVVRVIDSSGSSSNADQKTISMNIAGAPSLLPVITRIKVKGEKKFYIYGQNFSQSSLIILNGVLLTPKWFEQDGETGILFFKGKLNLGPAGFNSVFVQNGLGRSSAYIF